MRSHPLTCNPQFKPRSNNPISKLLTDLLTMFFLLLWTPKPDPSVPYPFCFFCFIQFLAPEGGYTIVAIVLCTGRLLHYNSKSCLIFSSMDTMDGFEILASTLCPSLIPNDVNYGVDGCQNWSSNPPIFVDEKPTYVSHMML